MSSTKAKPVVMVAAMLLEPVQTASERFEPGTVVTWPKPQVDELVANKAAELLTAEQAAEAKAQAEAAPAADAQDPPAQATLA